MKQTADREDVDTLRNKVTFSGRQVPEFKEAAVIMKTHLSTMYGCEMKRKFSLADLVIASMRIAARLFSDDVSLIRVTELHREVQSGLQLIGKGDAVPAIKPVLTAALDTACEWRKPTPKPR